MFGRRTDSSIKKGLTVFKGLVLAGAFTALGVAALAQMAPTPAPTPSATGDYYPLDKGDRWVLRIDVKGSPSRMVTVVCDKLGKVKNLPCFHLDCPDKHWTYWVEKTDDGLYTVQTFRSVLGLANLTITLDPPIKVLKFPCTVGDQWEYQGWGRTFLASKRLHISFENKGLENIPYGSGTVQAYRIEDVYQVEKEKPVTQVVWYGEDLGFLMSHNDTTDVQLLDYSSGAPVLKAGTPTILRAP